MEQEQPLHEAINDLWKEGLRREGLRSGRKKTDQVRRLKRDDMNHDDPNHEAPSSEAAVGLGNVTVPSLLKQTRDLMVQMSPEELAALAELVQKRQAEDPTQEEQQRPQSEV